MAMRENPRPENVLHKKKKNQAERLFVKFGGARRLAALLRYLEPDRVWVPSAVYKWAYSKKKGGTGGIIPSKNMPLIEKAARLEGIFLTPDDYRPGEF